MKFDLKRRVAAEALGTAFLLAAVVGSGIMAERLAGGNMAIALLANTVATGAALFALILSFGQVSGAHFNPAVTLCEVLAGKISRRDGLFYLTAQIAGAIAGTMAANVMFERPMIFFSQKVRTGGAQWFSEFVATFGLVAVILAVSRISSKLAIPAAVAAYITAAYWFTASTSFANPAVTIARTMSDTFAGIRPFDAPGFIVAQLLGAVIAFLIFRWLSSEKPFVEFGHEQ